LNKLQVFVKDTQIFWRWKILRSITIKNIHSLVHKGT